MTQSFWLAGCADKTTIEPFECKCDCKDVSFECIGQAVHEVQDGTKKYIKNIVR